MITIEKNSFLWEYLPAEIKELISDGEILIDIAEEDLAKPVAGAGGVKISDYSFLVFPFSKAYEGFLKKFLLDMQLIRPEEYYSDDIRIGRILNPKYIKETGNVFARICDHSKDGQAVSAKLWETWKRGRNLVFHYFPHNFRKLSYKEAMEIILQIVSAMGSAVSHCRVGPKKSNSIT